MSTRHLVDPELAPLLDMFPDAELSASTLAAARAVSGSRLEMLPPPPIEAVRHRVAGRDGAPDVPVLLFKPEGRKARPAILHMHGGGMVMGSAHGFRRGPSAVAARHDAVVVSVDYRLAPETPFPGPQEDCYAALDWMFREAPALGIDPARVAVMGESAGGGLAAGVAHMVRDRGAYRLCGQILSYPMLDHRTGGPDDPYDNPVVGEFIWTREKNRFGWSCLRGDYPLDDDRIGWFSPAVARDLSGLPPTYIGTGSLDLFFDENLDYAQRLCRAGVSAELHSYAGAFHGFDIFPGAAVSRAFARDLDAAIGRMLA